MPSSLSEKLPKTNSRTFRGIWVRPRMQLMLCSLLSFGFLLQGGLLLVVLQNFNRYVGELAATSQVDQQSLALYAGDIVPLIRIAIISSAFFALVGLAVGIVLGHRIFGPMVPIRAHVKRLIAGNYKERVRTRSGDEFTELVLDLNVLAEMLETKSKS